MHMGMGMGMGMGMYIITYTHMHGTQGVELDALATKMSARGFSGADITNLCRDAAMMPMRRAIKGLNREEIKNLPRDKADLPVSQADLEQALERIHSSVSSTDLQRHQQWLAEFGSS